jgi:hypothetical protein
VSFPRNRYDKIVTDYLLPRNSHLKFAHPHQTSRGKQNCSQDYPMPPKFQDKIVQAKKNQVLDSATDPPSPRFSCPGKQVSTIYKYSNQHLFVIKIVTMKDIITRPSFKFRNVNATLNI